MNKRVPKLINVDDLLARDLEDPEFKAEWERLAAARAVADIVESSRLHKGLTQTALARVVGVSQPVIARIESGEHSPTIETLIRIASALDIELTVVITPAARATSPKTKRAKSETYITEVTASHGTHLLVAAS